MSRKNYNPEPFTNPFDRRLSEGYKLVTRNGKRLTLIYVDPITHRFLATEKHPNSNVINPLEFVKDGKHASLTFRGFDIIGIENEEDNKGA